MYMRIFSDKKFRMIRQIGMAPTSRIEMTGFKYSLFYTLSVDSSMVA